MREWSPSDLDKLRVATRQSSVLHNLFNPFGAGSTVEVSADWLNQVLSELAHSRDVARSARDLAEQCGWSVSRRDSV